MTREQMIDEAVRRYSSDSGWSLALLRSLLSQPSPFVQFLQCVSDIRYAFERVVARERCIYHSEHCRIC